MCQKTMNRVIWAPLMLLALAVPFAAQTSLAADDDTLSAELINGRTDGGYPASVVVRTNKGSCTGTIVGERTLLFASHCADNNSTANFIAAGQSYRCTIAHSPRAPAHDLSLCLVDRKVEGIAYESVNTNPYLVASGSQIVLSGYGCIYPGGSGGNDGHYRVGESYVYYMPNEAQNVFNYVAINGSAVCYGDSGGPAFKYLDSYHRVVISTNSAGDIRQVSYLTSTSTQASIDFLWSWSSQHQVKICGVHQDVDNCR